MIHTLSSHLTVDFYMGAVGLLLGLFVWWMGFQAATRGAMIPVAIYAVMIVGMAAGNEQAGPLGHAAAIIAALILNGVMLAAALRHALLTYILSGLNALCYFSAMGTPVIPQTAALAGALLSLAYGGTYFFLKFEPKRERERIPQRPAPRAEGKADDLAVIPVHRPRYTFKDVVGMDETKARLLKAGQDAMQQTPGQPPRNGILLFGEPGNGKTFLAEALAGELKISFIKLTNAEAASRWVGQTTENVSKAFAEARAEALRAGACMLFIDEIDSFLENREASMGSGQEASRTANALLTLINDIRGTGVLLVGATNFIDRLDSAGVREGRFDFKVEIPPPDEAARRDILGKAIASLRLPAVPPAARTGIIGTVAPGIRRPAVLTVPAIGETSGVERAAKRWEGFSGARLRAVGLEAVEAALREGRNRVDFDDLMRALRTLQGTHGDRIPEDTPGIDGVYLTADSHRKLKSVIKRMTDIERIEELGGTLPSGVLFYGPPGTGKTFAARALAKESGWAFIATNGQELLSDREAVKKLIKKARDIRPVIVFIDEADDVLADRSTNAWNKAVTNDLLTAIDGAKGRVPDIVWIAATNMPDALDTAVVRGGRFTEKILFGLPDEATLTTYIAAWRENSRSSFDPGLTPGALARLIGQASIANVQAILQTAVNHMIGDGHERVQAEHVVAARDEVLAGTPSI